MPIPNSPAEIPSLINTQTDLDLVCEHLSAFEQVAIDTEFVRTNTYAPMLGLLQLAAGDATVCIDPLADLDMAGIWNLLFDPARTSVMHAAKQDLEVMWFDQGQIITNLIDTQVCAALLGYPAQIGYAGLCQELLGLELAKSQTRTDWSRRPLTEAQLEYAAEDVVHLPEMLEMLTNKLVESGRYEWAIEDSKALCDISLYKPEPEDAWQRLKAIPFMPPAQQARARALASWRESRAISADKPRGWILSDKALLQIADQDPRDTPSLRHIDDLPPAVQRKQGSRLIGILDEANQAVASGAANFRQEFPNPEKDKAQVKACSKIIRAAAEDLGIAPEVLGSKRDIQTLMRTPDISRLNSGWRGRLFGNQLKEALN